MSGTRYSGPALTSSTVAAGTIVLSLIAYAWYLASQQGTQQSQIIDLERRMTTVESTGSPQLQSLKTQLQINDNRLSVLEQGAGKQLSELLVTNATQEVNIKRNTEELGRLRDYREHATIELTDAKKQIAELRGDIIAIKARADMVSRWIESHQSRDEEEGKALAALKLAIEATVARLDRMETRVESHLSEGKQR